MENVFLFDNSYERLPSAFYQKVLPSSGGLNPKLIAFNQDLANELQTGIEQSDIPLIFSGKKIIKGSSLIAMAYAGHQFGHFSPQLGDGRAILLGEVIAGNGARYDIQLKGCGPTPFSRRGDGQYAIGPAVREFILSEAMAHLGIPTTRALAIVATGADLYRDRVLPGAVFTRVALGHIRIGTFEYFYSRGENNLLKILTDYSISRFYPETENNYYEFFRAVAEKQISLIAKWMSVGFIHGVMNSDNVSISGETLDYGPAAFMDEFNFNQVFSFIDRGGRYAYGNQPTIALWNLARFADSLTPLMNEKKELVIERFSDDLNYFSKKLQNEILSNMAIKIGILNLDKKSEKQDHELVLKWCHYLQNEKIDFTMGFRKLSDLLFEKENSYYPKNDSFLEFISLWRNRLSQQGNDLLDVEKKMKAVNPAFIPRNHLVQQIIDQVILGDMRGFNHFNETLKRPYDDQVGREDYQKLPEDSQRVIHTFCGT